MNLIEPFINMGIIVILISISLGIAICFVAIFYWSVKSGQYDDTYTPSVRMLFDSKPKPKTNDNAIDAPASPSIKD